jgi:hypothetical protein
MVGIHYTSSILNLLDNVDGECIREAPKQGSVCDLGSVHPPGHSMGLIASAGGIFAALLAGEDVARRVAI